MKGSDCLVHWGFYRVKTKQDTVPLIQGVFFYFIHRFYCKNTGKTISLLPDFLHPRKRYTQRFVNSVFDRILGSGDSSKKTGRDMRIYFQTILKWLANFSKNRHQKSLCFSFFDSDFDWQHFSTKDYCVHFWKKLKKSYSKDDMDPLRTGTYQLWEGFNCPMY